MVLETVGKNFSLKMRKKIIAITIWGIKIWRREIIKYKLKARLVCWN